MHATFYESILRSSFITLMAGLTPFPLLALLSLALFLSFVLFSFSFLFALSFLLSFCLSQ